MTSENDEGRDVIVTYDNQGRVICKIYPAREMTITTYYDLEGEDAAPEGADNKE